MSGHVHHKVGSNLHYIKVNILVDSGRSARLADFGLTMIIDESTAGSANGGYGLGGTTRWMAPELLYPENFGFPRNCQKRLPSKGTDIYALGMTMLEVCMPTTEQLLERWLHV